MALKPISDRVVLKSLEVEEKTKGGLFLAGAAQEKPQLATVVAVGDGTLADGKKVEMIVKVGDTVVVSDYAGKKIKYDSVEYTIVRQDDILAIVE